MNLMKQLFAGALGTASGLILVVLSDTLCSWLHPRTPPSNDGELPVEQMMQEFIDSAPASVQVIMVLGWGIAVATAAAAGRHLSPQKQVRPGLAAGLILVAGVIANLFAVQHPLWMNVVGPLLACLGLPIGLILGAPNDYTVAANCRIAAPLDFVFNTISTVDGFQSAVPQITNVEFLTEQRSGVGTRFRETRVLNGKEAKATLEIAELEPLKRVRMLSNEGGVVWDSVFTVNEHQSQTELKLVMEARPTNPLGHLMVPLILNWIQSAIEADMSSIKSWCETAETDPS